MSAPAPVFPDHIPTVPELLRAGSERHGADDCVVTPDARVSYAELDRRSRLLAARLVGAGVGKGTHVGVLFPNGWEWVVAWAAVARLGAVAIPVNTFYRTPELGRFLRHADVQVLLGVASFLQHDYLDRLETIAPELAEQEAGGPEGRLLAPTLPQLRRILLWGDSPVGWAEGGYGAGLGADGAGADAGPDAEALTGVVDGMAEDVVPADPMLITYTSGSTGEPKGVVHSHGALIRHARNLAALSDVDGAARLWTPMPLCWVGGFSFTLLRAMTVGAAFLTQDVLEAGGALALMERERVTHVSAWPAVSKSLREHPDFATTNLASIRSGSFYDAVPADRRPADPGLAVTSLGMSETCGPHTFWYPEDEVHGAPEEYRGTFGHEVPGTEHRIIDSTTGAVLPPGEEGEVLVRGYSLMLGLYRKERAEVFDADGWYHTGDRGYFRDGWFFFTGRQSDLIKTAGSNVAPIEVEMCLMGLSEVKMAFVLGVPHPDRGQEVVALVVPDPEVPERPPAELAELARARARDQLSSYKVPRRIFVIGNEDVPWLTSQKADRRALVVMAEKLAAGSA
ncbi:MAG TPA: class I adenylate-forming enzyme family protein [Acidimicrobiales bacterium]|nr:class I adenylate-forming enzyme family protein [Acidimicrobiales bacterium]